MTLDKIFKDGAVLSAKSNYDKTADYEVKITKCKNLVSVYFASGVCDVFKGEKVVPMVVKNRVYFARESQVNASDATRNKGYTLTSPGNSKFSRKINTTHTIELAPFIGKYSKLHLDLDCMVYFIEKPTVY